VCFIRKQQKTRKVVESDDEEIKTVDNFMDADLADYGSVSGVDVSSVATTTQPPEEPEGSSSPAPVTNDLNTVNMDSTEKEHANGKPDVHEHELEGFLLPEGEFPYTVQFIMHYLRMLRLRSFKNGSLMCIHVYLATFPKSFLKSIYLPLILYLISYLSKWKRDTRRYSTQGSSPSDAIEVA